MASAIQPGGGGASRAFSWVTGAMSVNRRAGGRIEGATRAFTVTCFRKLRELRVRGGGHASWILTQKRFFAMLSRSFHTSSKAVEQGSRRCPKGPANADRCQRYPWNEYTVNYSKSTSRSRRIDAAGTFRRSAESASFSSAVAVEKQPAAP